MLAWIVDRRYAVIALSAVFCCLGGLLYFKMPLLLLPNPSVSQIAIRMDSNGQDATSNTPFLRSAIETAMRIANLKGELSLQVNRLGAFAVIQSKSQVNERLSQFQNTLSKELEKGGQDSSPYVFLLEPSASPSVELALTAQDENRAALYLQTSVLPKLKLIPGIKNVLVPELGNPIKVFQPSFANALQQGGLLSIAKRTSEDLAAETVFGSQGNISISKFKLDSSTNEMKDSRRKVTARTMWNGDRVYPILIFKQPHASDVDISSDVRKVLEDAKTSKRPEDPELFTLADNADFIRSSEESVLGNLQMGMLLTTICVFIFFRKLFATGIVSLSIPIAFLISVPPLYLLGVSRNVMSLAGLALAVGIVVDATLSMVEKINEEIAGGRDPKAAAKRSIKELFVPTAMTGLTTLAVFVPILFLDGYVGDLFYDLSITVIVSQLASFVVSIFLTPALTSAIKDKVYLGKKSLKSTPSSETQQYTSGSVMNIFLLSMRSILERRSLRYLFVGATILLVTLSFSIIPPREFISKRPSEQMKGIMLIRQDSGMSLAKDVDTFLESLETKSRKIIQSGSQITMDFKSDKLDPRALEEQLNQRFFPYKSIVNFDNPFDQNQAKGNDLVFFLPKSHPRREEVRSLLSSYPGIRDQFWSDDLKEPTRVVPNHSLHPLGYEAQSFALRLWSGALPLGFAPDMSSWQTYPILMTLGAWPPGADPVLLQDSGPLLARGQWQESALKNSSSYVIDGIPFERISLRIDGANSFSISDKLHSWFEKEGIPFRLDAANLENSKSISNLILCLGLALAIIFLLMLIQSRDLPTSIVVMFTFIWGPIGVFPGLQIHGETFNSSVLVGFILLAGTIVNNGILVMDLILKGEAAQKDRIQSCLESIKTRSMPVIVTSLTTVVGMLPMVFDSGAGSQMYRGLAIVVVYGTIVSTPISLVGIPCLYIILSELRELFSLFILKSRILLSRQEASL